MTGHEYREAIKAWGMTQLAASNFFRVSPRLGRTWAQHGPAPMIAVLIRVMQATKITPADVDAKYRVDAGGAAFSGAGGGAVGGSGGVGGEGSAGGAGGAGETFGARETGAYIVTGGGVGETTFIDIRGLK